MYAGHKSLVCNLQICSPCRLSFHFLNSILWSIHIFHSVFFLTACTFGVLCKKPLPNPKPQIFNLMLCSKGYADLYFPSRPMSQFELILYRVWDRVTIHAFVYCYPVVQELFNKEPSSSSLNYIYNLAKSKLLHPQCLFLYGPKCPSLCQYLLNMEISSLVLTNGDPKGPTKNYIVNFYKPAFVSISSWLQWSQVCCWGGRIMGLRSGRKNGREGGTEGGKMSPKGYLGAWWEKDKRLGRKLSLFIFAVLSANKARKHFTRELNPLTVVAS